MAEHKAGNTARNELVAGVNLVANTVRITLGPHGRLVVIERPGAPPLLSKDGATVAAQLELHGRVQNAGASLLKEAAARTKEQTGDGSTTATVLAQAMVAEGAKYLAVGINPASLRSGIEAAVQAALATLGRIALPCDSDAAVRTVAMVATNGDRELADLISQAVRQVGREGLIRLEEGRSRDCSLEMIQGFVVQGGYLSPHFVTSREEQVVRLEACRVLVYDGRIDTVPAILPLLDRVSRSGVPLLIAAHGVAPEVLAVLATNVAAGTLKICVIKSARTGQARTTLLGDLALACGTDLLSPESGAQLADVQLDTLGLAEKVEATSTQTVLLRPQSKTLGDAIRRLSKQLEEARDAGEKAALRERLANLKNEVCVLRIGADTALELNTRMAAAQDAVRALQVAVAEGTVPGGGVALVRCCDAVRQLRRGASLDVHCGIDVVLEALTAPARQILANAGIEPLPVLARVAGGTGSYGFDAVSGTYGDLQAMGILDPAAVTRAALRNAASVAVQLLSTEAAVASGQVV